MNCATLWVVLGLLEASVSLWEPLGAFGSLWSRSLMNCTTLWVALGFLKISGSFWEPLGASGSLWELLGAPESFWEPLKTILSRSSMNRATLWMILGLLEASRNLWEPLGTSGNLWKPLETPGSFWKPLKTILSRLSMNRIILLMILGFLEISGNLWESLGMSRNLWKLLGTLDNICFFRNLWKFLTTSGNLWEPRKTFGNF